MLCLLVRQSLPLAKQRIKLFSLLIIFFPYQSIEERERFHITRKINMQNKTKESNKIKTVFNCLGKLSQVFLNHSIWFLIIKKLIN